jgi:hypothetical protein
VLSVGVHNHYKWLNHQTTHKDVELAKSNILLIGPTGAGKASSRKCARDAEATAVHSDAVIGLPNRAPSGNQFARPDRPGVFSFS